ncbi:elongation factor Tu GTP-binding domain protein (macronuclear) [Tetrahymena thermophila SB210]|uniref:Eukaryotic translation initiation factor 5B n=1 Tax=Tetrahymena thermophila (strain SB210) TaxID=312017 RepID=I7MK40_TETTS|nr:elongation factor Tu GTP-binding domain protein [Tetrahymena thermophila SB210]EAS07789.1 elongation factor Tu GTP-binding domain protein [Tetrahymena thermophila SB210]|eukprot:XP_001028031.1 elongation factor Tu GTP-binding domain protein [Tetrahymena thermophila SB210]
MSSDNEKQAANRSANQGNKKQPPKKQETPKKEKKQLDESNNEEAQFSLLQKKNTFAFSISVPELEEAKADEVEIERQIFRQVQEEIMKEKFERKQKNEEEKMKDVAEKKRVQQEVNKKLDEEELFAVNTNKMQQYKPKDEDDYTTNADVQQKKEGEGQEGVEKKLSKAQKKKIKEKQKKEIVGTCQDTNKKKKTTALSKAAQAALENQAKIQKEKKEKERLEAAQKLIEEEQRRRIVEEKQEKFKLKQLKKELKNKGLIKTKEQLEKEEVDRIKNQAFLKSLGVSVSKVEVLKQVVQAEINLSVPKKKKVEKDPFGFVIKKEEKVNENVQQFEGDVLETMKNLVVPELQKYDSKLKQDSNLVENELTQSNNTYLTQNSKYIFRNQFSKQEDTELEKAEKETKKAARDEKILQGQNKSIKVEDKENKKQREILRSPIVCILGHVDTGKTTLLDKLRGTNVQGGEAGGITQQIGATYFPSQNIAVEIEKCNQHYPAELKAPGLLVIDTPGHESFSNLRTRGSSLCDFAILVIDLMHGLEQQTLESLNLLKMRKTPFVIALNKIDRTYDWKTEEFASSYISFKNQSKENKNDFNHRYNQIITQLAENSFNAALYWDNPDPKTYFPIVPTSGVTGEGIPDLLSVVIKYTSMYMKSRMVVKQDAFNCTVMEVKKIDGLGVTIDAILVDGTIRQDDKIVLLGFNGPIKTKIRALLTPYPMKEIRVKAEYEHHNFIHASMGIKISAPDLEEAVAGSQLYLANTNDEEQTAIDLVMSDYNQVKKKVKLVNIGVGVAASTLGSLEALLDFLEKKKIPVSYVSVGPVSKDSITKALKSVLADDPKKRKQEYACMLVFDVKILPDAQKYAEENGVKILTANIIYHLQDQYVKYVQECEEERKKEEGKFAVFPCLIKPLQFFNKSEPIIMGVDIERGTLKPGTQVCLFNHTKLKIGVVESIEINKKSIPFAKKETGSVAIRIGCTSNILAGRHFTQKDYLVSIINRRSIDALEEHYKDEVTKDEWLFIKEKLKPFFKIL